VVAGDEAAQLAQHEAGILPGPDRRAKRWTTNRTLRPPPPPRVGCVGE